MTDTTSILVQVMAAGGKFVGDDIGGAAITVRDADTKELLASDVTKGDSGPNGAGGVMCAGIRRGQKVPTTGTTSSFSKSIPTPYPRRIEVSAFGPLGARGSANTVSTTTWLYPGQPITAGNGILLELQGLICQIINPQTHMVNFVAPANVDIVANVAMMCGCPISSKPADAICPGDPDSQPWLPSDFNVVATLVPSKGGAPITHPLTWDSQTTVNGKPIAGRYIATVPGLPADTYQMTIVAQQQSTGNTGLDLGTFVVAAASN